MFKKLIAAGVLAISPIAMAPEAEAFGHHRGHCGGYSAGFVPVTPVYTNRVPVYGVNPYVGRYGSFYRGSGINIGIGTGVGYPGYWGRGVGYGSGFGYGRGFYGPGIGFGSGWGRGLSIGF